MLPQADFANRTYDVQVFEIHDVITQHIEPKTEILAGFFQFIVAGHDFSAIFSGSMLKTPDIFVEIVGRSEFHSAASLNNDAAPNNCHFSTNAPPYAEANCRSRIAS
jgi:hypothetical protein